MHRIARAPPVMGLALAFGVGVASHHLGVPTLWTLFPLLLLLRPKSSSSRPLGASSALVLALIAGGLLAAHWARRQEADCRLGLQDGASLRVRGTPSTRIREGRGEIRVEAGLPHECRASLRFVLSSGALKSLSGQEPSPGAPVDLSGQWRRGEWALGQDPLRSGYLRVQSMKPAPESGADTGGFLLLRARVQDRLGRLFPSQAALVEALVLARKEGLTPEIRDAFARAGTAHLLAISGFHVGVVAGLLLLLGGILGLAHPVRFLLGSMGVWFYVLLIGIPDAALRAAVILSLLTAGRILRRPVAPLGALATAFLLFLAADPGALLRVGFQLSFAGALGLVLWSRPLEAALRPRSFWRRHGTLASGLAAGVSATLATLPLVAWHFGRVSLVGIPVTLLATPLIALAIPGIILSLLASFIHLGLGQFLAGGVEVVLRLLTRGVEWVAGISMASVWVSRPAVVAGVLGLALGFLGRRLRRGTALGPRALLPVGALAGVLLWPWAELALHRNTLEMVVLDVGQGDALALRSPAGRWLLLDAGPRTETFDAGARRVLPFLRSRGVREVAFLVLSHPDMDHVGGAGSILREFPVGTVLDPGRAVGSQVFLDALRGARGRDVPWRVLRAGDSLNVDGVALRILWPPGEVGDGRGGRAGPDKGYAFPPGARTLAHQGSNEASVVVELRYGEFSALLTGDAPREVEEAILPFLLSKRIQLLKVGHHGSSTSTSAELLERLNADVAVISVGRRNRYGHPHPAVLRGIRDAGLRIFRTDRDGSVRIRARMDGSYDLRRLTSE